jgi:hypothetical protein
MLPYLQLSTFRQVILLRSKQLGTLEEMTTGRHQHTRLLVGIRIQCLVFCFLVGRCLAEGSLLLEAGVGVLHGCNPLRNITQQASLH